MKKNRRMLILTSWFTAFAVNDKKGGGGRGGEGRGGEGRGGEECGLISSKKLLQGLPVIHI